MSSSPAEFVCVAGGSVNGVQAEAVIYQATGRTRGAPVYFAPLSHIKSPTETAFSKALTEFAQKIFPENLQNKWGVGFTEKWGPIALANPGHNPLKLNSQDGLNLVYDLNGKLEKCFVASEDMPDPDFSVHFDVVDKRPAVSSPAPAPSLAPAR